MKKIYISFRSYALENKSNVFETFLRYQKRAERFLDLKVVFVRTDGGLSSVMMNLTTFWKVRALPMRKRTHILPR